MKILRAKYNIKICQKRVIFIQEVKVNGFI